MMAQSSPHQPEKQPTGSTGTVLSRILALLGGLLMLAIFWIEVPWPPQAAPGSLLYIHTVQEALQNLRETGREKQAGQQAAAFPSPGPSTLLQNYYFCPYCRIYHPRWMLSRTTTNQVASPSLSPQTRSSTLRSDSTNTTSRTNAP